MECDIATTIRFRHICDMLDRIENAEKVAEKEKYFLRYYRSFLKHRQSFRQVQGLENEETGESSFYSILRCIIPNADNSRRAYGLQKHTMGRIYTKILHLSSDSPDAKKLQSGNFFGDYASLVHRLLVPRCRLEPSELTVKEIHEMLDSIADDDIRTIEMVLTRLTQIASAREQKWIVRLLLKSMGLGIGEQRIFGLLHPNAKDVYQRCSNLKKVCCFIINDELKEDDESVQSNNKTKSIDFTIEPFQVIKPMLCERFAGDVQPLMADDVLYIETKMDGERFQIHYLNETFQYFSRNGINYTKCFGGDESTGPLTSDLKGLLPIGMTSMILDGEMMVWNTETSQFVPKGENTDVKHLNSYQNWRPCFIIYDILYFNGRSMLAMPYIQRVEKIRQLFKEKCGVLQLMKYEKITSLEHFRDLFQSVLQRDEEGVVVKKQNSVYMPGTRNGGGWYKIKADYIDGLTTDFDLIVMGGFYNEKKTFIESFLLGVIKEQSDKIEVYSVGKVMNVTSQRVPLNDTLKPYWVVMSTNPPPLWYHCAMSNAEGRPDVWIEPQRSVILQIKAADLAPSTAFALRKSLHFPRIQMWRNDKLWMDCMKFDEYEDFIQNKRGLMKINKRELTLDDLRTNAKRLKLTPAQKRKLAMEKYAMKFDPTGIEKTSELLSGFSVCILSGSIDGKLSTNDLKKMVIENGGELVEYPYLNDPRCFSIAGRITSLVQSLQNSDRYNILHLDWFINTCAIHNLILQPDNFIHMTADLRRQFADNAVSMDGDDLIIPEDMEISVNEVDVPVEVKEELDEINNELAVQLFDFDLFQKTNGCFYDESDMATKLAHSVFRWLDGKCFNIVEGMPDFTSTFYVFINKDCENFDGNQLRTWLAEKFSKCLEHLMVVDIQWIIKCHERAELISIDEYLWAAL